MKSEAWGGLKLSIIPALALSLSGCAAVQTGIGNAGQALCSNADSLRTSYALMIANSPFIVDPVIRQMVVNGAQSGLIALDACPPAT